MRLGRSLPNNSLIANAWVWPVNEENWPIIEIEKKWAVDTERKTKETTKGDLIVFYVPTKTGVSGFRGAFKILTEWKKSTISWNDRDVLFEVDLEEIETGFADISKLSSDLDFINERKDSRGKLGLALKGTTRGPGNSGNPIKQDDYEKILTELRNNKNAPRLDDTVSGSHEPPEQHKSRLKNHNLRLFLVKALFENLMGPKSGPDEEIGNPRFSYVVGILKTAFRPKEVMAPNDPSQETKSVESSKDRKMDADMEESSEGTISADQDLNPFLGAHSMGVSFVVTGESPRVSICFTWGRYVKSSMTGGLWRREPNFYICDVELTGTIIISPRDGVHEKQRITREGVEIQIVPHRINSDPVTHKISIFLVNNTKFEGGYPTNAEDIFQPQIRINTMPGTNPSNLDTLKHVEVEASQKLLLNDRRVFASGHFCGALWKDVDPEDVDDENGFESFTWPDSYSAHFPAEFRKQFTRPDIRTEYFPSYSILQPDLKEKSNTEFDADMLAETWDPKELKSHLSNLLNGYGNWISCQREDLTKLGPADGLMAAGEENIGKCEKTYKRIDNGIKFLVEDEKARASFCLMNKVMATKAKWESGQAFSWWEFQMAFILSCLAGVAQKNLEERDICDILWFPTGGGKTEAYIGLMIFAIAYRRLSEKDGFVCDGGVSVISRYTLRLLTIQQFQRTIGAIVAADFLRVSKWKPRQMLPLETAVKHKMENDTLWGRKRFSIGLWIGDATPNKFSDSYSKSDATRILRAEGMLKEKRGRSQSSGEPAQINSCPCCGSVLSISTSGLNKDVNTIFWVFRSPKDLAALNSVSAKNFDTVREGITVVQKEIFAVGNPDSTEFYCVKMRFKNSKTAGSNTIDEPKINRWWNDHVSVELGSKYNKARLSSTSPSRPGYFFVSSGGDKYDFVIHCPNPGCGLNRDNIWFEEDAGAPSPPVPEPFRVGSGLSAFMPISAYTVDEQIYRRCPTVLISTVDKFAMLPYLEDSSSIFGNVDSLHRELGYGRSGISGHLEQAGQGVTAVRPFLPPSLIIQDELHLIEGPLGSMVGIYEAGIEILASTATHRPKYIASSATIKESAGQVGSVFRRPVSVFPPMGISVDDNYFSENKEDRKSVSEQAGRLYLGISSPNGILTTPVRIWSTLLGELHKIRNNPKKYFLDRRFEEPGEMREGETFNEYVLRITDPYWTLIGYFNAIRELQIARSLYGDDIMQGVKHNSIEEFYSITHRGRPVNLQPAVRFVPVTISTDCKINGVSVFCNNSLGRISIILYDSDETKSKPRNVCAKAVEHTKRCERGENNFQLKEPLSVKKGDTVWIGLINDDLKTAFQAGESELQSYSLPIRDDGAGRTVNGYVFPEDLSKITPEDTNLNLSLHTAPRGMDHEPVELTGQTDSHELPHILQTLNMPKNKIDAVFTTAVFGTGVDIPRLGLMVVMGQPKTTSTYIQSTGRVGRRTGGLVVTWLKSSNVRDLNHYENFVGYHRLIQHFVEPVSAAPYSDVTMRTCLGSICVSILRNGRAIDNTPIDKRWVPNDGGKNAGPMTMRHEKDGNSVRALISALHKTITDKNIPEERSVRGELSRKIVENTINLWHKDAVNIAKDRQSLHYYEWAIQQAPTKNVVLGSLQHELARKTTVYDNSRTSMREVEPIANFGED